MSKAKVQKRSKVKPFIKVVNYNHIMYDYPKAERRRKKMATED
jgi:hypothetical protein